MTNDDQKILALAAEHQVILPGHVAMLLKITAPDAQTRLGELGRRGLIRHHRVHHRIAGHYQITSRGLHAIDSPLPEPRFETIRDYRHDVALPYLTLYARGGRFGELDGVLTQRGMRHHDTNRRVGDAPAPEAGRAPQANESSYGVPLGTGLAPNVARHYPDLMLLLPQGRIAVELQVLRPGPRQLAAHVAAYGADPYIAATLYLNDNPDIGQEIAAIADQLGLHDPTHVQRFTFGSDRPATSAQ